MKTTKKETMYQNIEKHGNNLNVIFGTNYEPISLSKKLFRLERQANKIATDWCNGVIDEESIDNHVKPILDKVTKILGSKYPVKFNGDARGYSLKISDKIVKDNNLVIYQDWGGYGIIAPDFNN